MIENNGLTKKKKNKEERKLKRRFLTAASCYKSLFFCFFTCVYFFSIAFIPMLWSAFVMQI